MKNLYCTAFFITEQKGVNVKSSKRDVYFKCICVFFASLHKFHPNDKKVLFLNTNLPKEYEELLKKYNVTISIISSKYLIYVTNKLVSNSFPGCLFALDVFNYLGVKKDNYKDYENIIMLDNDTLLLKKINIKTNTIKGILIDYDFNKNVNGKSRAMLSCINSFNGNNNFVNWFGGEFICANVNYLEELNKQIKLYFNFCAEKENVLGSSVTEEHIFSIIISNQNNKLDNKLLKRIWTTYGFNNVTGEESEYTILHYPSEKSKLFLKLFSRINKDFNYLQELDNKEYKKLVLEPVNYFLKNGLELNFKKKIAAFKNKFLI